MIYLKKYDGDGYWWVGDTYATIRADELRRCPRFQGGSREDSRAVWREWRVSHRLPKEMVITNARLDYLPPERLVVPSDESFKKMLERAKGECNITLTDGMVMRAEFEGPEDFPHLTAITQQPPMKEWVFFQTPILKGVLDHLKYPDELTFKLGFDPEDNSGALAVYRDDHIVGVIMGLANRNNKLDVYLDRVLVSELKDEVV